MSDARLEREWGEMVSVRVGERRVRAKLEVEGPAPAATNLFLELVGAVDRVINDD